MIKILKEYYETKIGKLVCIIALILIVSLITVAAYLVTSIGNENKPEPETTKAVKVVATEATTEETTTTEEITSQTTEETTVEATTEETTEEQTTEEITTAPPVISMEDLDVSDGDELGEDAEDIRDNVEIETEPETTTPPETTKKEEPTTKEEETTEEETQDEELLEDNKNVTAPTPAGAEYGCIAHGIDVSKHQGNIDWAQVKEAGYTFAIIRCGYRGYETGALATDSKFEQNIKGALENGIQVGIYFFSQAITEKEAQEEASLVINLIKDYNITYPVVFDWETAAGRRTNIGLSNATMTKIVNTYLSMVENAGYTGMVYGNKTDLSRFDIDTVSKNYKVWFARYTTTYYGTGVYYKAGNSTPETICSYQMWQYTSTGRVPGISTNVDMNVAFFSYEGSGVPAAPLRIELTHDSFEIRPGGTVDLLDGVTAISSSAIDISQNVTYEIFNEADEKVDKKTATNTKGEYKVVYYINDFTGVTAQAEAKLIVGGEPKIYLNNYNVNWFVDSDCEDVNVEQLALLVEEQIDKLLEDNLISAKDHEGNDLTSEVTLTKAANYNFAKGSYVYTYKVTDSLGYEGTAELVVNLTTITEVAFEFDYAEIMAKVTDEVAIKDVLTEYLMTNIESGSTEGIAIILDEALSTAIDNNGITPGVAYKVKYVMDSLDESLYYKECEVVFLGELATSETTTQTETTIQTETSIPVETSVTDETTSPM